MGTDSSPFGKKINRTFTETARRAQIVTAAIDTIAELGYGQASLARIAETAGTSKSVILYHFSGRDDLIRELVAGLAGRAGEYLRPRVDAQPTGASMLRAYIEANLVFMGENRALVVAAAEIALNARGAGGRPLIDQPGPDTALAGLRELLAHFQGTGEFRAGFDPLAMAMAIRAAIDAAPPRLAREPGFDLVHYARELAGIFDLATSPPGPAPTGCSPAGS